ncbi:HPr(Ser) kinase/phosphatase [Candidatus Fermentibacterales bacterium]|nr:HPr(Ser) kinase/phosphatase [Candidatus Fermentibacterales bacterium]
MPDIYPDPDNLTVAVLLEQTGERLRLSPHPGCEGGDRMVQSPDTNRPGLCLTGYTHRFLHDRIQIFGETEITYLGRLPSEAERRKALAHVFCFPVYCCIVTKGLEPPTELVDCCRASGAALLVSPGDTTPLIRDLTGYLSEVFCPKQSIHGSLVDVYGVGILCTGRSAIGKSESVLGLVERGHRFVADDVVRVRRAGDALVGMADATIGYRMELRGIGVVDVATLYGIRAIKSRQQVDLEVRLTDWSEDMDCERTGLETEFTAILGVKIPLIVLPVLPGRNITLLIEVAAMTTLLRRSGRNAAVELDKDLIRNMIRRLSDPVGDQRLPEAEDPSPRAGSAS